MESDGITCWVNSPIGMIGRFSKNGVEISRITAGRPVKSESLFFTEGEVKPEDWIVFVGKMWDFHKVPVADKHRPERFKVKIAQKVG